MKLLAISEHYYPRVGGTVNYVHETLSALVRQGVEAELWVPGPAPQNWRPEGMAEPSYDVKWIDAGYPARGDPTRAQRYDFCQQVTRLALSRAVGPERPDMLHVLFGLFVMEVLDTAALRAAGVPSAATVHNVPPMECRQIAHDAPLTARMKEALRLRAVSLKNASRLRRHGYDLYVVPSDQVKALLTPIVGHPVVVVGHGTTSDLLARMTPPQTRASTGTLRLLTAGGYVPHKRQHIIPETAAALQRAGLDIRWDVVGPPGRVPGYFDGIAREVEARRLEGRVILHGSVPVDRLAGLYDAAHLYVQPSIEEGFCLTALDAAAAGLPVIGCRAGALPEIIAASGGELVESSPGPLAKAVAGFVAKNYWRDPAERAALVKARFSWTGAAAALLNHYQSCMHQAIRNSLEGPYT